MDPDVLLEKILSQARVIHTESEDPMALEMATDVLELHEWLRKGGFLPLRWVSPR